MVPVYLLNDGRTGSTWESDRGLLQSGRWHHVAIIVDGGPKIITFVVDGRLCDGGQDRQFGWGRFNPQLRSDMEGLTGVVNMNQVVPGASDYDYGLRLLMHDLQAVIDGLLQHEDDEIVVYDIHFFGTNIDMKPLDPWVKVINGKPNYTPANLGYLAGGFDGVILLGLHARAGVPDALLGHNYEHDILKMSLNGLTVGEIGMEAAIAGEAGVPLASSSRGPRLMWRPILSKHTCRCMF